MQKTIGLSDFQKDMPHVVDEVAATHVAYILTQKDRPCAALVPYDDFLRLQKLDQDDVIVREFDEMWGRMEKRTAERSEDEIARDVALARGDLQD